MQYQLAMAKEYAFRIARGATGIKSGGDGVFIKIWKIKCVISRLKQRLILAIDAGRDRRVMIIQPDDMLDTRRIRGMIFDHRRKF